MHRTSKSIEVAANKLPLKARGELIEALLRHMTAESDRAERDWLEGLEDHLACIDTDWDVPPRPDDD
jgi:hypothetical protein